jgi:hypothetical protein
VVGVVAELVEPALGDVEEVGGVHEVSGRRTCDRVRTYDFNRT